MGTRKKNHNASEHVVDAWLWTNPRHCALSADARLLFTYLWTAPECPVHGLFVLEPRVVESRTGLMADDIPACIETCVHGGMIAYDAGTRTVLVMQKWERAKQVPAARQRAITMLADSDSPLIDVFFALYPDLRRPVEASIRLARGGGGEVVSNIPEEFPLFMLDARLEEQWNDLVAQWTKTFPAVNVIAELQLAHAWLVKKRGTKQGDKSDVVMFLHNWMRKQDGGRSKARTGRASRDQTRSPWE